MVIWNVVVRNSCRGDQNQRGGDVVLWSVDS